MVYSITYKFRLCITTLYRPVKEQERIDFYNKELKGAALVELVAFRCTTQMLRWLKSRALVEGRDYSQVLRRCLTEGMKEEGFDPDGII